MNTFSLYRFAQLLTKNSQLSQVFGFFFYSDNFEEKLVHFLDHLFPESWNIWLKLRLHLTDEQTILYHVLVTCSKAKPWSRQHWDQKWVHESCVWQSSVNTQTNKEWTVNRESREYMEPHWNCLSGFYFMKTFQSIVIMHLHNAASITWVCPHSVAQMEVSATRMLSPLRWLCNPGVRRIPEFISLSVSILHSVWDGFVFWGSGFTDAWEMY